MSVPDLNEQFLRLYADNQRRIHAFIGMFLAKAADVDDVLQETSIVLWRKFAEFDQSRDFLRWACGVAKLEVLKFYRQQTGRILTLGEDVIEAVAEDRVSLSPVLEERREALMHCMGKLTTRDRELIERCYGGQTTTKHVAEQLGRPVNAVYKSLGRIRRALFECIERRLKSQEIR